ncbi:MAG: prolipoprotein diacylglyceryl transferase [Vulcanimicrobiota bacterium]
MHPVALKIGNFTIYFYGLMMVVAYIVVLLVMKSTRQIEKFDMDTALDCSIYAIIGGVIGSRLLYVFLNFKDYLEKPLQILNVREGGLSWHGALIGGFIALLMLAAKKKMPVWKLSDFTSVHVTVALAIGRIGCFLNGCCYGKLTDCPLGVEFKSAHIEGLRHPTQLYESALLIVTFFILLWWWKRKKFDGEMTLAMFGTYGVIRLIVEFFRYNTPDQYPGASPLSLAQLFSILLILGCTAAIIYFRKKTPQKTETTNEKEVQA